MAADREVLREVWEGKLPICFELDSSEVEYSNPDKLYVMVPRLSYFPLVVEKVKKHFIKFISSDNQDNEMWLAYKKIPLKWHYPIGVLFDMHKADIELPWTITVHFDKFPENQLLSCKSRDIVLSHFKSCLKEADALKHKTQLMPNMQFKDTEQLWLGLQNDKFDQFWAVNRKLMELGTEEGFKYIPFRIYHSDNSLVQKLVKPVKENGERKTLLESLEEIFPEAEDLSEMKIITHGIQPSLDTPLQWMSEHLSYPDNFLHLVVATS